MTTTKKTRVKVKAIEKVYGIIFTEHTHSMGRKPVSGIRGISRKFLVDHDHTYIYLLGDLFLPTHIAFCGTKR